MYAIYCANQKTAYKTLARCTKTNVSFREALQQAHDNEQTRLLNLDSYLIKPMQRLCKYPLLLRVHCLHTFLGSCVLSLTLNCARHDTRIQSHPTRHTLNRS
jgi:hypothetical protein